jgi:hypothetical protein
MDLYARETFSREVGFESSKFKIGVLAEVRFVSLGGARLSVVQKVCGITKLISSFTLILEGNPTN